MSESGKTRENWYRCGHSRDWSSLQNFGSSVLLPLFEPKTHAQGNSCSGRRDGWFSQVGGGKYSPAQPNQMDPERPTWGQSRPHGLLQLFLRWCERVWAMLHFFLCSSLSRSSAHPASATRSGVFRHKDLCFQARHLPDCSGNTPFCNLSPGVIRLGLGASIDGMWRVHMPLGSAAGLLGARSIWC